jgi:hypothetical protein
MNSKNEMTFGETKKAFLWKEEIRSIKEYSKLNDNPSGNQQQEF